MSDLTWKEMLLVLDWSFPYTVFLWVLSLREKVHLSIRVHRQLLISLSSLWSEGLVCLNKWVNKKRWFPRCVMCRNNGYTPISCIQFIRAIMIHILVQSALARSQFLRANVVVCLVTGSHCCIVKIISFVHLWFILLFWGLEVFIMPYRNAEIRENQFLCLCFY